MKEHSEGVYGFQPPDEPLPFTGERFTPELDNEIALEHFHRYLLALAFCRDKEVLDVACGEGYGTALIAQVARRVTGVDSARDAIDHCNRHYASEAINFRLGEAKALPLEDSSVDVVVSFETVEHFAEHEQFIAEVERVLRPGGTVILSTPDRPTYATITSEPNEFHVRELDRDEFMRLLRKRFRHVVIGGQRSGVESTVVFPKQASAGDVVCFDRLAPFRFEQRSELGHPVYLIAVASNRALAKLTSSVFSDREFLSRVHATYHGELEKVWKEVKGRENQLSRSRAQVSRAEASVEAARVEAAQLGKQLEAKAADVQRLESASATSEREIGRLEERLAQADDRRVSAEAELGRLESETSRASVEIVRLEAELADRQAESERIAAESEQFAAALAETQWLVAEVTGSTSWRVTAPLRALTRRLAALATRFTEALSPIWRAGELRPVLRRSRTLRVLRHRIRRLRKPAPSPLSAGAQPLELLGFFGEEELPQELRDDRIVADASAWTMRMSTREELLGMTHRPLISVVMPTYNTPVDLARQAVESVVVQTYPDWELCIVDDGSLSPELHGFLDEIESSDSRIRIHRASVNQGIAGATNEGLRLARGDFVAFLDHDDELLPDALLEVVRRLNGSPDLDVVYTDQSYLESDGSEYDFLLKPDWSPTLFRGVMYVGHLLVVRRDLAISLGGFDPHFNNVQDFEFMLRVSEATERIAHVSKVLYRWRRVPGSVAFSGDAKPDIEKLQAEAVTRHLERLGIKAVAESNSRHAHRVRLVPTFEGEGFSIGLVLVADSSNGATSATVSSVQNQKERWLTDIVVWRPQDQSGTLSDAFNGLATDFVLCLDANVAPEADDWLAHLLLHAQLPDAGVTGGLVLSSDGRVEDAGLIIGLEEPLSRAMGGWDSTSDGFAGSLSCAREVSAISGTCAMTSKQTLGALGGISPHFVSASYAWVDLSLRARRAGLRNVLSPQCLVRRVNRGSSLERSTDALDFELLKETWSEELDQGDPYHNPNFGMAAGGYRLSVPVSR